MKRLIGFLICIALAGCDNNSPSPAPRHQIDLDSVADYITSAERDAPLLEDLEKAEAEFEHGLVASINVQDGLLLVRSLFGGQSYVLPADSAWVLSCGDGGIQVAFSEVEIHVTKADIEQKDCAMLSLRLGKRLKSILEGGQ